MSVSSPLSASLLLAQQIFTRNGYPLMVALGTLGNILSILLFLKKTLRNTSCNIYFLASAITNLVAINVGIITLVYVYDHPSATTVIYCRMRSYILNSSQQMSRFFIVAACFDRFALCSPNAHLRKVCQARVACRYIVPCITLVWLLLPLHIPVSYITSGNSCVFPGVIALYNSIYGIIMAGFLPPILMLVFSILIFHNLKLRQKQRRQIHPSTVSTPATIETRRQQMRDQQVLVMLLAQVFIYLSSTAVYPINLLYTFLTMNDAANKSAERKSIEAFVTFVTGVLIFVYPCLAFYSFTVSSHLFRKEFKYVVLRIWRLGKRLPWMKNNNQISTTGNITLVNTATIALEMKRGQMQI